MRIFVFGMIVILSSLYSFAQRVNEHGLKMVSEIILTEYIGLGSHFDIQRTYSFEYNDNNKLCGVIYVNGTTENKSTHTYRKTPTSFTYETDSWNYQDSEFDYDFDMYDHIARVEERHKGCDGSIEKYIHDYQYEYDENAKRWQMTSYSLNEWYKPPRRSTFYKQELSKFNEFIYKDGYVFIYKFCKDKSVRPSLSKEDYLEFVYNKELENREYDRNRLNDTNVDLTQLLGEIYRPSSEVLLITEWIPYRIDYLPSDGVVYKYEYVYEGNNVIEIRQYYKTSKGDLLKKQIRIRYLH